MSKKNWLVLIYANGNNDLAPEIYNQFKMLKELKISKNIKILVQISGAPFKIVNSFRNIKYNYGFEGNKRYEIDNSKFKILEELNSVNMANPLTLLNFLLWGYNKYPDYNLMVILSGHGAGFLGLLPDYTFGHPYIMSLKNVYSVFSYFYLKTKKSIDFLVFDICYMNMMEIMCKFLELNIISLICSVNEISLEGIYWYKLIEKLNSSFDNDLVFLYNRTIKDKECLLSIELKNDIFNNIKSSVSKISEMLLQKDIDKHLRKKSVNSLISFYDYINFIDKLIDKKEINNLRNNLKKIIMNYELQKSNGLKGIKLFLPEEMTKDKNVFKNYNELKFSYNNKYTNLIFKNKRLINVNINYNEYDFGMKIMNIEIIIELLINYRPDLSYNEAYNILRDIKLLK